MRLTRLISERPHGAEGKDEEHLTGYYCRGEFEATALVERLYRYEETGLEPEEVPESQWIPINKKKPIYHSEGFLVTIKNPYNKRLEVERVWYDPDKNEGKRWWSENGDSVPESAILAWIPLPEPYNSKLLNTPE